MNRPLEGIKIVEMASHGACPSCCRILSDWGADVIKVEALNGDAARTSGKSFGVPTEIEMNPHFDLLNSGKKSIALNLKSDEGAAIMAKLLKDANAFVSNFRGPALERLGLDYDTVANKYPHLIWAHLSGFGEYGPDAANAGFDTVAYYAKTGAMLDFAEVNTPPINAPFGVGDLSTGSTLAGGIAAALFKQQKTGEGEKVTVSLYGQSIWSLGVVLQSVEHGAKYPKSRKEARVPMNNSYQCKDGEWLYVSVLQYERYFADFCKLMDREDLIDDPRYCTIEAAAKNNTELIEIFDEGFKKYNRDEWIVKLHEADIANDKINHLSDVSSDPQALENNFIYPVSYDNGESSILVAPPIIFGEPEKIKGGLAPKLSENADDILTKIGYTETEINNLKNHGIVGKPQ